MNERALCLTINQTEDNFKLCWTDYFAESGFDRIERREHLNSRDDKDNQTDKDVELQYIENQSNLAEDLKIERNIKEIKLENKNINVTIFGTFSHDPEDSKFFFMPTHVYTNTDIPLFSKDEIKKGFEGKLKQESTKDKRMLLILNIPLKIDPEFLILEASIQR